MGRESANVVLQDKQGATLRAHLDLLAILEDTARFGEGLNEAAADDIKERAVRADIEAEPFECGDQAKPVWKWLAARAAVPGQVAVVGVFSVLAKPVEKYGVEHSKRTAGLLFLKHDVMRHGGWRNDW